MDRLTVTNSEGIGVLKQPYQCERCGDLQWSLPDLGNGSPIDRLAEYEDLEEQGKLLKLPCAVGDTVYRINKGKKEPVIPMQIIGIAIRNENELVIQTKDVADDNHNLYSKNSIGKTVFLTGEEAEVALQNIGKDEQGR